MNNLYQSHPLDVKAKLLAYAYNFSVYVRFPKIGGIGPLNMLQLKSLQRKFGIKPMLEEHK